MASARGGRARFPAYLDDHAFLADALLELLQCRWRGGDFQLLIEIVEVLLQKFQDGNHGGFFFTASDAEALIHRSKTFADDSLPAGNAIAASVLCRLGLLLGEMRYLDAAERCLQAGWSSMIEAPQGHLSLINAMEEFLRSAEIVIIRGKSAGVEAWRGELARRYAPHRMVFAIAEDAAELPPALAAKRPGGVTLAYVCTGMTCGPPIDDLAALLRRLG
jgi:uncharacterized protein YyaL (SSP411 family)